MGSYASQLPTPSASPPPSSSVPRWLQLALAVVVIAAAVISGSAFGGDERMVVLPLAAVAGLALGILALTRFATFVLLILGARASLDAFQFSSTTTTRDGTTVSSGSAGASLFDRGLDPGSLLGLLFLLAAVLWLAARHYSGTAVRTSRLTFWLTAFWLASAISIAGSAHKTQGALEALRLLSVVMMFVVLEQLITNRRMLVRVLVAAYASLLVPLGYTIYGMVLGNPASEDKHGFVRIVGTFTQSNGFGRYLAFMVIFGVAIYPHVKGRAKPVLTVLLALSGVFLVLTLTLGAMIGALVGIVLVALVQRRHALIVSVVALAAVAAVAAPGLSSRVGTFQEQQVGGPQTSNSLIWRVGYWTDVLPLANSNPVTGIGLSSTVYETSTAKQPHNDFIRAYVETGVLGLLGYLGMLGALVGTCRRAVRRTVRRSFDHAIASGALACAVCFILESIAANVITDVVNLWYLFAFAACAGYVARAPAKEPALLPADVEVPRA